MSIATTAVRAEDPPGSLPQVFFFPEFEPTALPDDSEPLPRDVFSQIFPGIKLPTTPYASPDIDGDGQQDFIVPLVDFNLGMPAIGRMKVFNGWTGNELYEVASSETNDLFGFSTLGVPDLTGDGGEELLVSAIASGAGAPFAGRVYLYTPARTVCCSAHSPASSMTADSASP